MLCCTNNRGKQSQRKRPSQIIIRAAFWMIIRFQKDDKNPTSNISNSTLLSKRENNSSREVNDVGARTVITVWLL